MVTGSHVTVRFEREAPNTGASSDPYVALEFPASCETQSRPRSVLVQNSGHVNDDVQISALDVFCEKDERENRCIGDVLEWYRGKDARDLERIELNVFVEKWRYLNDPGRKLWKSDQEVVMDVKSNQKIVMDEELVQEDRV